MLKYLALVLLLVSSYVGSLDLYDDSPQVVSIEENTSTRCHKIDMKNNFVVILSNIAEGRTESEIYLI